jgi:hypothetical protein
MRIGAQLGRSIKVMPWYGMADQRPQEETGEKCGLVQPRRLYYSIDIGDR